MNGKLNRNSRTVIISGCQRSGTTLLKLILSVNNNIIAIDEDEFEIEKLNFYKNQLNDTQKLVLKLPALSHQLLDLFPNDNYIWVERSYKDVVYSMNRLMFYDEVHIRYYLKNIIYSPLKTIRNTTSINPLKMKKSWAIHKLGALKEIKNCSDTLKLYKLHNHKKKFDLTEKALNDHPQWNGIIQGITTWLLKKDLLQFYTEKCKNQLIKLSYDDLLSSPQSKIKSLCEAISIPFDKKMISHHLYLSGMSIGNTKNYVPINKQNNNKWKTEWSLELVKFIDDFVNEWQSLS